MSEKFLMDTNTFITPYVMFYAPDLAPTFWKRLKTSLATNVAILDLVRDEILKGEDGLSQWLSQLIDENSISIIKHGDEKILHEYSQVLGYLQNDEKYTARALRNWSIESVADPWLIATAKAYNYTIVTFETSSGPITTPTGKPKIPDVANHFCVKCENLYYYMKQKKIFL